MPRLAMTPRHRATPELKAAYDRVAAKWGARYSPPVAMQIVQCFSAKPESVEPAGLGYYYAGWAAQTPRDVLELTAVLVSQANDCFY